MLEELRQINKLTILLAQGPARQQRYDTDPGKISVIQIWNRIDTKWRD
jgi:hypothetical protein